MLNLVWRTEIRPLVCFVFGECQRINSMNEKLFAISFHLSKCSFNNKQAMDLFSVERNEQTTIKKNLKFKLKADEKQ